MKRILVVDHKDSFVFNLVQILRSESNIECSVVDCQAIEGAEPADYDAIVLSPGPGSVEEYPQTIALMQMNESLPSPRPVLGVCLGHQLMGVMFGLELFRLQEPAHGAQSEILWLNDVPELGRKATERTAVGRYHSLALRASMNPSPLVIDAIEPQSELIMALHHAKLPYHGVQFHPESILSPRGEEMIRCWMQRI